MQPDGELFLGNSLRCSVTLDLSGDSAIATGKKETCRNGELILGRNEFAEPVIQAHLGKVTKRFDLSGIKIHRRFMKEGKSSICLPSEKVTILISNCPPDKLLLFLKTLVAKVAHHRTVPTKNINTRERLFMSASEAPFTEISPLCEQDVQCVRVSHQNLPSTTPTSTKSVKRKRNSHTDDTENINPDKNKQVRRNITLSRSPSELTRQQYSVLEAISTGKNVFFTGSAGTGKSFLLKRAIGSLPPEHTFATASTGIAASHISGMTLHSFAGIGSGKADLNRCLELANRPVVSAQWKKCRHLIIDEISMVHAEYFAKLEAVARVVRKSEDPFGGIQLIICGDFFQLPPIDKSSAKDDSKRKFAFQTSAWRRCIDQTIQLSEVKRQTDNVFINLLQKVRQGYCSPEVHQILTQTATNRLNQNGLQATRLSTHNDDVDEINRHNMDNLPGESRVFTAHDNDVNMSKKLSELCPAAREITLKKDAQIMLCRNINVKEGLVNGTRGVVVGFEKNVQGNPIVRTVDGKERVIQPENFVFKWSGGITLSRRQLPIKLAWAVSIHKSQGMTLDLVEMSLSRTFEYGQAYVALSRARSLQGLRVLDFSPECVKAHPKVREYYKSLNRHKNL